MIISLKYRINIFWGKKKKEIKNTGGQNETNVECFKY